MKITVIGGGNMGGAIVRGMIARGGIPAGNVTLSDPSDNVKEIFSDIVGLVLTADNLAASQGADLVIVAVKPWLAETVITQIAPAMHAGQVFASIVAGVAVETLAGYLQQAKGLPAIYRIIPNTAISLGESVTFIAGNGTPQQTDSLKSLFAPLGKVFLIEEQQMGAATALASCGIAYALKYIDASIAGGAEMGLGRGMAREIVMQTVAGALALLAQNGSEPQTEIDRVTTPGGITLKGLAAMQENGFAHAVEEGLKASKK